MECGRGVGINLLTGSASAHYCSSTAYAASSVMNYGLRGYFPPDPVGDAQPYLKPFATREHQQEGLALEQHIPVRILTSIPPPAILQFSARRFKEDRGVAAAEQGPAVVSATAEKTELAYSIVDLHQDPAVTEQENSVTGELVIAMSGAESEQSKTSKITLSGIRNKFKKKPKAKPTGEERHAHQLGKTRRPSFRKKFRKASTVEEVGEGSSDVGSTSSSVHGLPLEDEREGAQNGADAECAFVEGVLRGADSEHEHQESATGALVTEMPRQNICSPLSTRSNSAATPSRSAINPSSAAINPSSAAINPSSAGINPSSSTISSSINPSSSTSSSVPNFITSNRHSPSLPSHDSTELNRTLITSTPFKATSLDDFSFLQKLKEELTASVSSVHSEPPASSTHRTVEKTSSLISFTGEGNVQSKEEELSNSFNQKCSPSPLLPRRRTVSVMASCSLFESAEDIKAAKTAAIQRAKERRKPPNKPLPYALTKKMVSSDPEATPLQEQGPNKVKLGPRSSRPPVPSPPTNSVTTSTHDETLEKASLALGLKSPPEAKAGPPLPAKSGRAGLGVRPTRPPVPPPADPVTTPPHERAAKLSKPLPPSLPPKRNSSPMKGPTQARTTSPTKAYRLPTTPLSPPTHPPPQFCPKSPSTERKTFASSLPPRTVQRAPPIIPSPYSSNALELLKNRSLTLENSNEPARKLVPSHNIPSSLTRDVSPRRGLSQTPPTSLHNSAAVSSTPSPSKYNSGIPTAPPKAPVYEEINDWIIKGPDDEQCRTYPRAVPTTISGWTIPHGLGGAVVHPRSDSSDADEYVDMKSFLAEESCAADGPVDDLYVEMRPIKAGDVCPGDDACPMGEVCAEDDEVDYIHMNPVTLPTHPSLPSVPSLPSKTRAPSLPSRSEMGTLYHPPGAFAPICAADQVLPPRKTHSESVHMDPATHPALTALSSKPFPHQTSAPCLSLGSGVGALYPPPTGPAPIYAAIDQLLPPRKISFTGESLHYASSDLFSRRS